MTTGKLVLRSMKKNIKMYYLYFFAMIFSISLYFIFSTLQRDRTIVEMGQTSLHFSTAFQIAGILLVLITIIFTMYATSIFITRRSQEIGLYQLIGLSKAWVARVLILEHIILGLGALVFGVVLGTILSRLFILLFISLIGIEAVVGLSFSGQALIQTIAVFTCLIAVTSLQIILTIYRSTLLQLFRANNQNDYFVQRPSILSGILGIMGLILIGLGYYMSTLILEYTNLLLILMIAVLVSTILGTYLIFHVTISWLFYVFRKKQKGNLGLYNSLSVAPLMHRMKSHANSLTIITVLSAMTITMISLSYSLYYSAETDVNAGMPFDFAVENMQDEADTISARLEEEQIEFDHYQLDVLRFAGAWVEQGPNADMQDRGFMLFSAEQMMDAGMDVEKPEDFEAVYFNSRALLEGKEMDFPKYVRYALNNEVNQLTVSGYRLEHLMNYRFFGEQLLVSEDTFQQLKESIKEDQYKEFGTFNVFQLLDRDQSDRASEIFLANMGGDQFNIDYYTAYEQSYQTYGLLIFIAGILGFVFILSTGSILYFKQMTEAEQEKKQYRTLRQLGFQVKDIMKGILRKQLFIYLVPLGIGLSHSAFALKVGSVLISSSTMIPIFISMTVYIVIYLMFTVVTLRYYKSIIKNAL